MRREAGERWEVHLGNSGEILPSLAHNVSLLVTDPPYGVRYQSGSRQVSWRQIAGDTPEDRQDVYDILGQSVALFEEACQHLYVFGDWDLTQVRSVFKSTELVWDKRTPGMGDLSLSWSRNYEHIQFAVGHKASRTKGDGLMRKRRGAILSHHAVRGTRAKRHPTEKPVPLLRELIETSSQFGDVVLDPYMGAGSTGVAALLEGRRFVGIELDKEYFDVSVERLRDAEALWTQQEAA